MTLDTALAGRRDALNPTELLLAALSACVSKGIERTTETCLVTNSLKVQPHLESVVEFEEP